MANILGTSSEYVITPLASFKGKGLVALGRGKLTSVAEKQPSKIL